MCVRSQEGSIAHHSGVQDAAVADQHFVAKVWSPGSRCRNDAALTANPSLAKELHERLDDGVRCDLHIGRR